MKTKIPSITDNESINQSNGCRASQEIVQNDVSGRVVPRNRILLEVGHDVFEGLDGVMSVS
jgi:competence protein ComGC